MPWGQDRLVPIFLATLANRQQSATVRFPSAAEMLETFGLGQGGTQYRKLVAAFERIFGATIFFGTDNQVDAVAVFQQVRFNFMSEARLWYWRNGDQQALPEVGENVVVLSPEFYREITAHPIPTDLQAARAFGFSSGAGPVQLALVPLLHRETGRASATVWALRTNRAVGDRRIRSTTEIPRAP